MHRLPLSFALLTYCGYWKPTKWPHTSLKYHLYNVYSVFMILLLYFFTFCSCVDSFTSKNLEAMSDKFSLCVSVVGVCLKVANLFVRRGKIINVMNMLLNENCIARDDQEERIQRKNDDYARFSFLQYSFVDYTYAAHNHFAMNYCLQVCYRKLTIYCEILNESAVFFATVGQYKKLISMRELPVSDWMPYDLSSQTVYTISLVYQTVGLLICANTSVANETLIAGLMIQVGTQFEIFCHRARNLSFSLTSARRNTMSNEEFKIRCNKIIENLIRHHYEIYEFAKTVNSVFQYMIFLQFCISSIVLCLSVYQFSTVDPFSMNFLFSGFYLCCMLMQVYLYCWFGNEVTLKSNKVRDAIYDMDWTMLPTDVMKNLLLIIIRTDRPVKMTSGHVVVLSSQSFVSIMKMTYSSYNLLSNSTSK